MNILRGTYPNPKYLKNKNIYKSKMFIKALRVSEVCDDNKKRVVSG
jgi:hypothetical protein